MTDATIISVFVAIAHLVIGGLLALLVGAIAYGFPTRRPGGDGFGVTEDDR